MKRSNYWNGVSKKVKSERGFWEYVATVAIVLVLIAFIALPSLRTFATGVFTKMTSWWSTVSNQIFPVS
jgi:hypothetical protein